MIEKLRDLEFRRFAITEFSETGYRCPVTMFGLEILIQESEQSQTNWEYTMLERIIRITDPSNVRLNILK